MRRRIVIIGGGHAGGRVAQILAASEQNLELVVVGREPHAPYYRPPLSKGVLIGGAGLDDCLIWKQGDPAWARAGLMSGISASSLDAGNKTVLLSNGDTLAYDALVLATGSIVRQLSVPGADLQGIHTLRTFDDAVRLSARFKRGNKLLIVGGGFIGLEIAAAASVQGLETTVVEASGRLLSRIVPHAVGEALAQRHQSEGVSFRFGYMVERFISNNSGEIKGALLSSGEVVKCDLAVVGVGAVADSQLARKAGLDVDVGIRTSASLETSAPDVYACGDCVSFWHPLFEKHVRVEAWQNAEDHARVVAARILGQEARCDTVPFFWSDQYDLSMQIVGLPHFGSSVTTRRLGEATILYHLDARGRLVGATGIGFAGSIGREIRQARYAIANKIHPETLKLRDGLAAEKIA